MPDYLIKVTVPTQDLDVTKERLVRAKNEARALAHVVKDSITIERAGADDIIRLTKEGVPLEVAE